MCVAGVAMATGTLPVRKKKRKKKAVDGAHGEGVVQETWQ